MGGWPTFSPFFFSQSGNGCPVLAFFVRAGRDTACTMWFVMPRGLHRTYGAHHPALYPKDGAPHSVGDANEIKGRATRPVRRPLFFVFEIMIPPPRKKRDKWGTLVAW